ncbi:MAG TPA: hypothetical protein VIK72_07155 [Clostridiaceae bacterium]
MNKNSELLNYIHQNSEMGKITINQLITISKDEAYKKMLQSQFDEYKMIFNLVDKKLKDNNKEAKDINTLSKMSSHFMINLKTLRYKTPAHISKMLIQGSTMGIIDITEKIKEYADADKEIVDLAKQLLDFEQRNVEECKKYL